MNCGTAYSANTGFADAAELTTTTISACLAGYFPNTQGTLCTSCGANAAICTSATVI